MSNFLLREVLAMLVMATSLGAQAIAVNPTSSLKSGLPTAQEQTSNSQKLLLQGIGLANLNNLPASGLAASRGDAPEAILEQPEGTEVQMVRKGKQWLNYFGMLLQTDLKEGVSSVVFADNGDVYFRNPMSCMTYGFPVWLKGHLEGETVTVNFPQVVFGQEYNGEMDWYTAYAFNDTYTDDQIYPTLSDPQSVTFTYKDGVLKQDNDRLIIGLGAENNGEIIFIGYGDSQCCFETIKLTPQELPQGITTEKWAMSCGLSGRFIDVAFDGNDVYFTNLYDANPEFVVKGTIQGDKVVIEGNQYLGVYNGNYYIYAMPVKATHGVDSYGDPSVSYEFIDKLEMSYDAANRSMKAKENECIEFNAGTASVLYLTVFESPRIFFQATFGEPAIPADPCNIVVNELPEERWAKDGFAEFHYDVPVLASNGDLIDVNNLYYTVYVDDDDIYIFDPSDYTKLTEELEEVPATFTENWDFFVDGVASHKLFLWFTGYDRIGVQSIYKVGDEIHRSNIVYNDGSTTTGIQELVSEESDDPVTYYNLMGQRVTNPSNGVFIVKQGSKAYKIRF